MTSIIVEPRAERLVQWTAMTVRQWNWPLVVDGYMTTKELEEDVEERCSVLRNMRFDELGICILDGLPDELFHHA